MYQDLIDEYHDLKEEFKIGKIDLKKTEDLLYRIRNSGKVIVDPEKRSILNGIAIDLGEKIYEISGKYPLLELEIPEIFDSHNDINDPERRRRKMEKDIKDEVLDKIKFELEMTRMFSEIEQIKKILDSSRNGKEDGGNKLQQTLEKIKSDLEKLQKIVADKDQDALKKEVDVVKKIMHSQNKKILDIKDELEKSKTPPADNKDQGMKSELEQIRKMLEDSQKGKLGSIQETLEKIQESLEKKSASPAPSPPAPSPDIQGLKTGMEEIKKALEGSKSDKIEETLKKIQESVEKKPAPPPPPGENPLKGDIDHIKRSLESIQTDSQKTFNIINMVIGILVFIAMIVMIVLLVNNDIGKHKPTLEDLQNQMNELKNMIKKKASLKNDEAKNKPEVAGNKTPAKKPQTGSGNQAGSKDDCSSDDKPPFCFSLKNNETRSIVSGQVLIKLSNLTDESAFFELTLPNSKIYRMPDMKTGSRNRFECKGETYFFDLMKISNAAAQVKVSKRA